MVQAGACCRRMWNSVLLLLVATAGLGFALETPPTTVAAVPTDLPSLAPSLTGQAASPLSPNASVPTATTANTSTMAASDLVTAAPNATHTPGVATTMPPLPADVNLTTTTPGAATSPQPAVGTTARPPTESSEPAMTATVRPSTAASETLGPKVATTTVAAAAAVVTATEGRETPLATSTPTGPTGPQGASGSVALYLLLPVVIVAAVAVLVMMVSCLRKRIRLDKLRHQLLPLYNFDPQEGEDWETELLTEPRPSSQTPLNTTKPLPTTTAVAEIPKLRFSPDTVDV